MTEWQFIGSVAADAIGAAIAAIGFSVISNPPRRVIPCTAILAAIGHSICLLYTSPSPRDRTRSRMPSSA